ALVAGRADAWRRAQAPATLEVAMGLETAHPVALERLNKRMTPDDFSRAAGTLRAIGAGVRAFVLLGTPFVPADEQDEWLDRSVAFAFDHGADFVSIIPLRPGNGAVEALIAAGHAALPSFADVERALARALASGRGRVTADLWDLDRLI